MRDRASAGGDTPSAGGSGDARAAAATPDRVWTTLELVRWTAGYFGERGIPSPRLDAEVLLAHVLGCRRLDLYVQFERPVEPGERAQYRALIRRRAEQRVPVAYLTGEREFWSQPLRVTPDVLIPRPETEVLVRAVLDRLPPGPCRIADVGTGSGAIAAALALERPDAELLAIDASPAALAVAAENFRRLGVDARVTCREGSVLADVPADLDAIVSNPPYVLRAELATLAPELRHEPGMALDGGPDGLAVIRPLIAAAPAHLRAGGLLAIEIGAEQGAAVAALLAAAGAVDVERVRDLAGLDRVVCARVGTGAGALGERVE